MKIDSIGNIPISNSHPFLIAEAGVNHEGSLETAFEMIDAAAEAGADMIKFQSYKAETLASKNSPAYWDRRKEPIGSQYELFKKYDAFGDQEYLKISKRCKEKNILFLATPFDKHFIDFLESLMPAYKIASADITNHPLLKRIAQKKKPIILSVGASYLSEVEEAIRVIIKAGADQIALLHCVLEYPTRAKNANLLTIPFLKSVFPDVTIGWSDHIKPEYGCLSLLAAWMNGAEILEKHYTLDKTLSGNDHYHAMDPDDIHDFREKQQCIQSMLGKYGKTVLPCEKTPRKYARRSLVAAKDIPAGSVIKDDMITAKRPGIGISPSYIDILIGRKTSTQISEDELIKWNMLFPNK